MGDAAVQRTVAVGVPTLTVLVGILINSSRLGDLRAYFDARFDDLREMWRAERETTPK